MAYTPKIILTEEKGFIDYLLPIKVEFRLAKQFLVQERHTGCAEDMLIWRPKQRANVHMKCFTGNPILFIYNLTI